MGESPLVRAMTVLGGGGPFVAAGARMRAHWLDFATTGTVSAAWPPYTQEERLTLIMDDEDRVEADPRGQRRAVWERFAPQL